MNAGAPFLIVPSSANRKGSGGSSTHTGRIVNKVRKCNYKILRDELSCTSDDKNEKERERESEWETRERAWNGEFFILEPFATNVRKGFFHEKRDSSMHSQFSREK